jgi:ribosomal protein L11 methylase PrmA
MTAVGSTRLASSFRDPHGFVFRREGILYRHVANEHREHFVRMLDSGLYERLVADELLIPHTDDDPSLSPGAYAVVRPERIPFVSYPYEWSFAELRDAALATLRIQGIALDHGMSLRDASAYNVTFHRGRPILFDTTSFEILRDGQPWVAYRQFCQHFLAPLALMAYRDVRLGLLSRIHLEGVPLDLAVELLPSRTVAKPGLAMHLRMHAKSQRKHEADDDSSKPGRTRAFSLQAFRGLLDSLRKAIEGLPEPSGDSTWSGYYAETDHYADEALEAKVRLVDGWIGERAPATVWDLGANTGRFARLATARGIDAIAFDLDPFCVDMAYREAVREDDRHLLPLVMDLANPSPGLGWANEERETLAERGPADLVLALALVHHLAIGHNVPLPMIVERLAALGREAIVEFVPKDDPKVRQLLHSREDVFDGYTEEAFAAALGSAFPAVRREALPGSGRALYLGTRDG